MKGRQHSAIESPNGQPTELFRYMDRKYCEQMVHDGVIRLTKSSHYTDAVGMTEYQLDDEHFKSLEFESSGVTKVLDKSRGIEITPKVLKLAENPEGARYRISARVESPYWLFCLSTDLKLNLFESRNFNCDAAVIVRDPVELFRRMSNPSHIHNVQLLGGTALWQPVSYHVSVGLRYGMSPVAISPFFTKPGKYIHQKEFRFVIYPCYDARDHAFICLDSLKDICDVVDKEELECGDVEEVVWEEKAFRDASRKALLNNGNTLLAEVRGRKVRDIIIGEDGSVQVTNEKTYGNSLTRVLLDFLTDAPDGPRMPLDDIDLESFYKAEQISKAPVRLPKDD